MVVLNENKSKIFKILLIGAGNLGSRYLQGLLYVNQKCNIYVIDNSKKALDLTKKRIEGIENHHHHEILFNSEIPENIHKFDLAIVATTSNSRAELINKLIHKYKIHFWIIEKVLAQSISELNQISNCFGKSKNVWVNTPRRIMPLYKNFKSKLEKETKSPINIEVKGGQWGLACNSIHFIDLFEWITDSRVLHIDSSLIKTWFSSKRYGFVEANGEITIYFGDKSQLRLQCLDIKADLQIKIKTNTEEWTINEKEGFAKCPKKGIIKGEILYQSNLTAPLVEEIISFGKIKLPYIDQSIRQHTKLIDSFLESWNTIYNKNDKIIKIT